MCRHAASTLRSQRPITATTQIHQLTTTKSNPHPPKPPRPSGVTIVGPTTAIATHTTSQENCAQAGRNTIGAWLWTRPRHRDCVDIPDAGLHPHRDAKHKQHTHTQPGSSRCVPFGDPHVHKKDRSNGTKQECNHSSANTLVPAHHVARTHQIDDKSKERKKKGVHQQRVLC